MSKVNPNVRVEGSDGAIMDLSNAFSLIQLLHAAPVSLLNIEQFDTKPRGVGGCTSNSATIKGITVSILNGI